MIKAEDYIHDTLERWKNLFPDIIVNYYFDKMAQYHVITVEPHELFSTNEEYISEENKLWDDFNTKFPDEDIVISEPNCCLKIRDFQNI